jgi:hypothetical protein
MSLSRNWPGKADKAAKPPRLGSHPRVNKEKRERRCRESDRMGHYQLDHLRALMLVIRAWSLSISEFVSFHGRNDLLARHYPISLGPLQQVRRSGYFIWLT